MAILVVEDDNSLGHFLCKGLEGEGHAGEWVGSGEDACARLAWQRYELLILDLNLPGMDGTRVLEKSRENGDPPAVIVLTARSQVEERVRMFDLGADDFLPKPFSFHELAARVRARLRERPQAEARLRCGDLELDRLQHVAFRNGRRIELTGKEYTLLEFLVRNSGHPVTRMMIIDQVWKLPLETMTNVVDVYVNYLRKKVDGGEETKLIQTVRGVGYRLGSAQATTEGEARDGTRSV